MGSLTQCFRQKERKNYQSGYSTNTLPLTFRSPEDDLHSILLIANCRTLQSNVDLSNRGAKFHSVFPHPIRSLEKSKSPAQSSPPHPIHAEKIIQKNCSRVFRGSCHASLSLSKPVSLDHTLRKCCTRETILATECYQCRVPNMLPHDCSAVLLDQKYLHPCKT